MSPDMTAAEIRRHLSAAPAKVFAAFADAAMVSRWLTPSPDVKLRVVEFDFREGGKYRFAYHVPGGQVMTVNGFYRLIKPPSKIIFSWNIEPPDEHAGVQSEVTVRIAPDGEGSKLHIRHEKLTAAGAVERHREGWRGAIEQLSHVLAKPEQVI
jgi:uncharacterized protein YndB with AHSA1/START domain